MSELLPCPFCGGTDEADKIDVEYEDDTSNLIWWMACDCGARGPVADNIEKARKAWNKRAPPSTSEGPL